MHCLRETILFILGQSEGKTYLLCGVPTNIPLWSIVFRHITLTLRKVNVDSMIYIMQRQWLYIPATFICSISATECIAVGNDDSCVPLQTISTNKSFEFNKTFRYFALISR